MEENPITKWDTEIELPSRQFNRSSFQPRAQALMSRPRACLASQVEKAGRRLGLAGSS